MIRLGRFRGPDLTSDPEAIQLRHHLFDYLRRPVEERSQRRTPIDEGFFHSSRIKAAVAGRAHWKCALCEAPPLGNEFVDHFRPMSDARDQNGRPEDDYYAWLAYEIDNLIFVCRLCAYNKGSHFPVQGGRAPYIAPLAEVRRLESPLLVDPNFDQPDRHFDFLAQGRCIPLTVEGAATLSLIGLDRDELVDQRRNALDGFLSSLRQALHREFPGPFEDIFDIRKPFMGARLNVLKRFLQGITFRGSRISGPIASLPRRLMVASATFTDTDHIRIDARFEALIQEDRERENEIVENRLPYRFASTATREGVSPGSLRPPMTGGVSRVSIRDFKGIESLDLSIPRRERSKGAPCLMILGENAVGKSSILQAMALAIVGGPQARRLRITVEDFFRNGTGNRWDLLAPKNVDVSIDFHFASIRGRFMIDGDLRRITLDHQPTAIVLGYGPRRFFDRKKSERTEGAYRRIQTLFHPTATIAYPGTWLNEITGRQFEQVAQVLRIVLSLEEEDELVRDLDGRICVNLRGQPVPIEWLSEGYRSIFAMVADILRELTPHFATLREAEAIVLIDEIETHLHPRWKMRVMSSLRRALPNVQFIATTHDPLCLRGMDDREIVVLQRDADGAIVTLDNLPSIKGMRADQLLTSDYFGLSSTVDPQAELDVARYVALVEGLPVGSDSVQADQLISRLTIGDDAKEQVIHAALSRFLEERDRPTGRLRTDVREEAITAILNALLDDSEPLTPA